MTKPKTGRSTYHHGDLRNELVRVGRLLLEEVGPGVLSLREVARRVGVSIAAPRRHLADKEALLAAIAASGFDELASIRDALSAEFQDDKLRLAREMMQSYVDFAQGHKGLFFLMVGPAIIDRANYPELLASSKRSFDLFANAVTDYAASEKWPTEALQPLVYAAWTVEHGTAMLILGDRIPRPDRPIDVETMVAFSIASFLASVKAGPDNFQAVDPYRVA